MTFAPYEGYFGPDIDTIELLARQLEDPSSGIDRPAAVIVESIQGEGGVNIASPEWLRRLAALAAQHEIPLIVDDIQAGCGRSGDFFSFEESGIRPDIVVLSKSLSGYGLPMSLVLISPELDVWEPGGHTGTFRGNNLAFVGATAALRTYWADEDFSVETKRKGELLQSRWRPSRRAIRATSSSAAAASSGASPRSPTPISRHGCRARPSSRGRH